MQELEGFGVLRTKRALFLATAALVSLALVSAPAEATSQVGLAGEMEPNAGGSFEWYEFLGAHGVGSAHPLVLALAIIPFDFGVTSVGLDQIGGTTFFSIAFEEGSVSGLPYRIDDWNDVQATLDFSTQTYRLTVNGQMGESSPLSHSSASVQAFWINAATPSRSSVGWIDSVSLTWSPGDGQSPLLEVTFDDGRTFDLQQGTLTASPPPGHPRAEFPLLQVASVAAAGSLAAAVAALLWAYRKRSP